MQRYKKIILYYPERFENKDFLMESTTDNKKPSGKVVLWNLSDLMISDSYCLITLRRFDWWDVNTLTKYKPGT